MIFQVIFFDCLSTVMYRLYDSPKKDKKFMIVTPAGVHIHFGADGYEDYTMHKDKTRKQRYIKRHILHENWGKKGINTPGFWSRWLLWNLPTIIDSIRSIENKFGIVIEYDAKHDYD